MSPASDWPPRDASAYFRSEEFGNVMLSIVGTLIGRYPGLDFSDAVATAFEWFHKKGERTPDFLAHEDRFPSEASFRAYVRQALWNVARSAERTRKRSRELAMPDEGLELVSPAVAPVSLAAFHECRDRLPHNLLVVFEMLHDDNDPPGGIGREEWASSVLDATIPEISSRYDAACEQIRQCMENGRRVAD